jgi:tetratricopeptide (TPR) repeat protein
MSRELINDFLLISRYGEPPAEGTISQAFAAARLGSPTYQAANVASAAASPARLGTYRLSAPTSGASLRITLTQHASPALAGMGEGAFSQLTRRLGAEDAQTLRAGTLAFDVRLKVGEEQIADALRWTMGALRALVSLTGGVVVDPAAQTAWGIQQLSAMLAGPITAHLSIHDEAWGADSRWLHTHGLQKFGRPELDLAAIPVALRAEAEAFLLEVAEHLAQGQRLAAGQEIDLEEQGTVVAVTVAPDPEHHATYGRLRLADRPEPGARQSVGAGRLLARMALADAQRRHTESDTAGALEIIERILAADSDDCAALFLKARILLERRQPHEALELGELMDLRTPLDYRGPLAVGLALLAMGRSREALNALDRAIEREPEAAQAFAARAEAYRLLGDERLAAVDRARAAYLGV